MRTTLTLDDALARALKDLAHATGKPFRQVVNETIQAGLASRATPGRGRAYRLRPASLGGVRPGLDLHRALQLAEALEDEAVARKLDLRK